jgi:lysophospholipid acyltransferase (LPLAT)-like uncharacterized protein
MQHATCNMQHATCNMQHATCNMQHATCNMQHATCTMNWHLEGLSHWQTGSILTCWHGEILLAAALVRHVERANEVVAPMVRDYGTPRLMARFIEWVGLNLVYIPPYEAGEARRSAMAETLIPLLNAGKSIFFAADGHRAPAHHPQEDPLWLARTAQVPLLPFACSATPAIPLPTWDRKQLPLPTSRISVILDSPFPTDSTPHQLATRLHHLHTNTSGASAH